MKVYPPHIELHQHRWRHINIGVGATYWPHLPPVELGDMPWEVEPEGEPASLTVSVHLLVWTLQLQFRWVP